MHELRSSLDHANGFRIVAPPEGGRSCSDAVPHPPDADADAATIAADDAMCTFRQRVVWHAASRVGSANRTDQGLCPWIDGQWDHRSHWLLNGMITPRVKRVSSGWRQEKPNGKWVRG